MIEELVIEAEEPMIGVREVSGRTGYTIRTIRDAAATGRIPGYRMPPSTPGGRPAWRFRWSEVEAALTAGPLSETDTEEDR